MCRANAADPINAVGCVPAEPCPPGEVRYQFIYTSTGTAPPRASTQACIADADAVVVPIAAVLAAAQQNLKERITAPPVSIAPPNGGLVNLPVVVYADPQDPVGFAITDPAPATVESAPSTYRWTFSDGGDATGRGRPYEAGRTPNANPGYYVTHTFAGGGDASMTLGVTWTATATILGQTYDLDAVTVEADAATYIYEARSQLVAGG